MVGFFGDSQLGVSQRLFLKQNPNPKDAAAMVLFLSSFYPYSHLLHACALNVVGLGPMGEIYSGAIDGIKLIELDLSSVMGMRCLHKGNLVCTRHGGWMKWNTWHKCCDLRHCDTIDGCYQNSLVGEMHEVLFQEASPLSAKFI